MKKSIIFFLGILIISLIIFSCYNLNKSHENNENFITTENLISTDKLNNLISNSIKTDSALYVDSNSKVFEVHELIGTEVKNDIIFCYVKSFAQSYKIDKKKAYPSTGGVFTGVVEIKNIDNKFKVIKYDFPIESKISIELFPKKMLNKLNSIDSSTLYSEVENSANLYFSKNNITLVSNY